MVATDAVANITFGEYSLDIDFDKIEHDFDKQLIIIAVPQKNQTEGVTITYIIDIVRLLEVITITGYLVKDSTNDELAKKGILANILLRNPRQQDESGIRGSSEMILTWGVEGSTLQKFRGDIVKSKVTESVGPINAGVEPTIQKKFEINLQFSVGTMR